MALKNKRVTQSQSGKTRYETETPIKIELFDLEYDTEPKVFVQRFINALNITRGSKAHIDMLSKIAYHLGQLDGMTTETYDRWKEDNEE